MANKKKSTRRSRAKNPALNPALNLKSRQENIEDVNEYVNQLNDEEKDWLNRFMEEYNCADLNHKGKKLHKKDYQKKAINKANNARNRCILSRAKASNEIKYLDDLKKEERLTDSFEDSLIDKLDGEEF